MKNVMLFFALVCCGLLAIAQDKAGYKVGDIASDFKLKSTEGKSVSLSDYPDAKGYIIIFACNTCPVSKGYESRMIALQQQFATKGYQVVAINPNDPEAQQGESYADMQRHAKNSKFNFPYLEDPGQVVTRQYGALRTPHIYVLQKTSKGMVVQYTGAIDNDADNEKPARTAYVEDAVTALLAGNTPPVTSTKAVGCGVKWKRTM